MANVVPSSLDLIPPLSVFPGGIFTESTALAFAYALNWNLNELGTQPFLMQTWDPGVCSRSGGSGSSVMASWRAPVISASHNIIEVAVYARKTVIGDTITVGLSVDNDGATASSSTTITSTSFTWYFFELTVPNMSTTALASEAVRVGLFTNITGTAAGDVVIASITANYKRLVTPGSSIAYVTGGLISGVEPAGEVRSKYDYPFTAHIARQYATGVNILKDRRKVLMNWSACSGDNSRTLDTLYGTLLDEYEIGGGVLVDKTGRPLRVALRMEDDYTASQAASVSGRTFEYTAGSVDNWIEVDTDPFTTRPRDNTPVEYIRTWPNNGTTGKEWVFIVARGEGDHAGDMIDPPLASGFDGTTGLLVEQIPDTTGAGLFTDIPTTPFTIGASVLSSGLQALVYAFNQLYRVHAPLAITAVHGIAQTAGDAPYDVDNIKSYSETHAFAFRVGTRDDSGLIQVAVSYYRDLSDTLSTALTLTAKTTAGSTIDTWTIVNEEQLSVGRTVGDYVSRALPGIVAELDVSAQAGNWIIIEIDCVSVIPVSFTVYEVS